MIFIVYNGLIQHVYKSAVKSTKVSKWIYLTRIYTDSTHLINHFHNFLIALNYRFTRVSRNFQLPVTVFFCVCDSYLFFCFCQYGRWIFGQRYFYGCRMNVEEIWQRRFFFLSRSARVELNLAVMCMERWLCQLLANYFQHLINIIKVTGNVPITRDSWDILSMCRL